MSSMSSKMFFHTGNAPTSRLHGIVNVSSAKLNFNCTHRERTSDHPRSRTYLPPPPSAVSFFSHPFSPRAGFLRCARESKSAARSTSTRRARNTTIVRDNDNQRVKWGLISFGCASGWRETWTSASGGATKREREEGRKIRVYTPAKKHAGLYTT